MEDFAIRLYDLLETTPFEALSSEELSFVLQHMTEEEYRSHARIHNAANDLEYSVPEPLPLALPEAKIPFWKRPVPLYQAIAAAACIAFLVIVLLPGRKNETTVRYAAIPLDTINPAIAFGNRADTIIQFMEVVKFHEKLVRDTVTVVQSIYHPQRETRMLEATPVQYPSIAENALQNQSIPLSEDRTAVLLPKVISSESFGGR